MADLEKYKLENVKFYNVPGAHGIIPETVADGQETYITHFKDIGTSGYIYHCTLIYNLYTK